MPIINYTCECKHSIGKFFRQAKDSPVLFSCEKCGKDMKKTLSIPSSSSKIIVDNGIQARAVEVIPNIVELNQERSNKDYRTED
jgi:hypothetical protein